MVGREARRQEDVAQRLPCRMDADARLGHLGQLRRASRPHQHGCLPTVGDPGGELAQDLPILLREVMHVDLSIFGEVGERS